MECNIHMDIHSVSVAILLLQLFGTVETHELALNQYADLRT